MLRKKDDKFVLKDNKIGGEYLSVKAVVICKTDPPSLFSCKTNILWVVPFLQNRGDTQRHTERVYARTYTGLYMRV
jgi:hypothetical protein